MITRKTALLFFVLIGVIGTHGIPQSKLLKTKKNAFRPSPVQMMRMNHPIFSSLHHSGVPNLTQKDEITDSSENSQAISADDSISTKCSINEDNGDTTSSPRPYSMSSPRYSTSSSHPSDPTTYAYTDTTASTISCPSPFELVGDQCLYFATFAEENHQECSQICHSVYGELVAIRTASQMKAIIDTIYSQGFSGKSFWMDGTDAATERTWLYANDERMPGGTPFWAASEVMHRPLTNETLNCASLTEDQGFLITDLSCTTKLSPICEYVSDVSPPNRKEEVPPRPQYDFKCPPFFAEVGDLCLAFVTWADQTWTDASQTCHGLAGELVSFDDIEILRDIRNYLTSQGIHTHSFWIGATDTAAEGEWLWIDGTPVPRGTPFWGNRNTLGLPEPDGAEVENCLALTQEGVHYFRDKDCATLYNPLCITDPVEQNPMFSLESNNTIV